MVTNEVNVADPDVVSVPPGHEELRNVIVRP